jgi:hypothetical protein
MLSMRQGLLRFPSRGTALALLTTIVTACSGGSTTPVTAQNGITPSSLGSPAAKTTYKFRTINDTADLTFNQLLGISRSKQIVGYYGSGGHRHPNKGYRVSTISTTLRAFGSAKPRSITDLSTGTASSAAISGQAAR